MTGTIGISENPGAWIRERIRQYAASGENSLQFEDLHEPAWAEPLVGFSRGDDPLYQKFKEDIGPFYWTPQEIFAATFPGRPTAPEELTVISWILPQTEKTRFDNRRATAVSAERWARSRKYGEEFNVKLRDYLAMVIRETGREAVAPVNSPAWKREESFRFGFASSWSERHAAFASGLGTFGLSDGLITPKGVAMRCGSVIARIAVPPSARPYTDHHAYCLFYGDGSCGKCIERCPAGAITSQGHDKEKCAAYVHNVSAASIQERFGFETSGCGLCQVGVPCEASIPLPGSVG